jgi:hypothetical protein
MHDLDDHLAGLDGLYNFGTDGAFTHFLGEGSDNLKRHVSLKQRAAHFAHGFIDISLRQGATPCELVEYARQTIA